VEIAKRIPVAAGMGGGSADAAATLLALNDLCGHCLSSEGLHRLAATIGADVPFFLDPRPALGEGIGDRLRPVPLACDLSLVLVNPGFPVPVAWSYANLDRVPRPAAPDCDALLAAMAAGDFAGMASGVYNALGFAVRDKFPLLDMLRQSLLAAGCAAVAVSGSGPTLFGLVAGDPSPVASAIRAEYGDDVWVQPSRVRKTTD
jgi:4-diphosphocytidyl-2-C-methyl-D-erythritol kinase